MSRLPPETRMGAVHLLVHDVDRAVDFYTGTLGMRALRREGDDVLLGADEPLLRLTHAPEAPRRPAFASGLYHVAYLLPSRAHLARLVEHFAAFRTPLQGAADHLVSEALYLADPEGNGIEVYADRPRDTWTWQGSRLHMTTAPLDLDDLLAQAGDTEWQGMPMGARVGHVHLQVDDADKAEAFYRDVVGFDVTTRYGAAATFLSAGGYHHHLAANTWESRGARAPAPGTLGLADFTVRVPDRAAIDALRERAADRPEGDAVRLEDPAGNHVIVAT